MWTACASSIAEANAGPVLVCGSTVEGEEPLLLKAFENILVRHPRAVMLLAPRHPERFESVAMLLRQMSIRFWRRSLWNGEPIGGGVLLVDTIGELAALYALADVAFVGGSLVPRGGHNIIEPAQHGVAIVVGKPHGEFSRYRRLVSEPRCGAHRRPGRIAAGADGIAGERSGAQSLGQRAAETMRSQTGATARTADELQKLLAAAQITLPHSPKQTAP